jgi:hypothetical protein
MRKVKVVELLGMLMVGVKDTGKSVVDGEVNRQIQIYYNMKTFQVNEAQLLPFDCYLWLPITQHEDAGL